MKYIFLTFALLTLPAAAQDKPVPRFDVVSIRPCQDPRIRQATNDTYPPRGTSAPGRLRTGCYPLLDDHGMGLIRQAYAGTFTPINGGPSWVHSAFYEINAVAEGAPSVDTMMGPMLRALLEDRFKLRVHPQTVQGSVYVLSVARSGAKLHPFSEGSCIPYATPPPTLQPGQEFCNSMIGGGSPASISDQGVTLDDFSSQLLGVLDRPVINRTGLTGRFDIHLEFSREGTKMAEISHEQPNDNTSDPTGAPNLFTAIQDQLGLKLEPGKGSVSVLIIDHIEKPLPD